MSIKKKAIPKSSKKYIYSILVKLTLIISTIILLLFIIFQLFGTLGEVFGPTNEITIGIALISLIIAMSILLAIFEVLSIKEYRGYILRKPFVKKGKSYLTLEDIFENENRMNILREILINPGIHQNELLRNCDLNKGQLQWHLDVLLKNNIIKKEEYGQYSIYFPITSSKKSIEEFKSLTLKSETTTKVYNLIEKYPGISSSEISKKINLARNTVKYHIDKLSEKNLINFKEKGRKIELYPNIDNLDN